jgi:hypothetical protein
LVLAPRSKVIEMCREGGWEKLPTREALREFDWAQRWDFTQLRHLVGDSRMSRFDLREHRDHEVLDIVGMCIRHGEISVLRQGGASGKAVSETLELRRLIAQIEKQAHGRLSYRGCQYKLVLRDDLAKVPGRDNYGVVSQADALSVLEGMAGEPGIPAELLVKAKEKLSKDWRVSSPQPNVLVLLRRNSVQAAASKSEGPALTPSQIQQMRAPKEEVDPLMSGAGTELEISDVELPAASEEEQPPDSSAGADDSEAHPADSADSAELEAPDDSAKTAQDSDPESNDGNDGNDGADGTDAGTAAEDSKDNGGGGESEGGGSPEFW